MTFVAFPCDIEGSVAKENVQNMDDQALWACVHDSSLPQQAWTHDAHLRVAWMFLARYALDEAHLRLRVAIIKLNAAHGLDETPSRGYHETLTRTWLTLVAQARRGVVVPTSAAFRIACSNELERDAPMRFYSRERLLSLPARATFVAPDRAPLPLPFALG